MALTLVFKEMKFGVGDTVRIHQRIKDGEKSRLQVFEGMVIGIKNRDMGKSFTVRKIGAQKIGIEQIFPLATPSIEKIEVVRGGLEGSRHAKLYYTRDKSNREVEKIYSRAFIKEKAKTATPKKVKKTSAKAK